MPKTISRGSCALTNELVADSLDARARMQQSVSERRERIAAWHEWAAILTHGTEQRINDSQALLARLNQISAMPHTLFSDRT